VAKKGARLVTINSGPHAAFSNPSDYIQIAKCDELIRPESVAAMRMRQQHLQQPPPMPENSMYRQQDVFPNTPQIHVNPVIKIVNGNDNSTTPSSSGEMAESSVDPTFSSLQIQNPAPSFGGSKAEVPDSTKSKTEKTIFGGLQDFGSLVINKLTS
jgi:hypothetical protein